MKLLHKFSHSFLGKTTTLAIIVSLLTIIGPTIIVSGGMWDAISHLQKEPESFWTIQHVTVYAGVGIISMGAILGTLILLRNNVKHSFKTGIKLVIIGALVQIVAGLGDSISHDLFGIDGLISWSHQPLELGLVLASLGGFLILKNLEHTKLKLLLPFSILSFLFFTIWLIFNLVLIVGHVVQCIPVYEIFSSGCSIL
jgi:hypothetical protein